MADNTSENAVSKRLVDLRVVDLKLELEKRSLEKTGVKQALLERLKKALLDEGQDPESYTFQVSTPNSVKVPKKTELLQENVPSCEDIGSDTSELISIGYETDEKDLSLEICHIIDEDIPETEEASSQPDGESASIKEAKCDPNISDEDLSFQDDDPVKLCIDESPLKISEAVARSPSPEPIQKDESHNQTLEPPPTLDEQSQSPKPDESISESFEIETNDLMPSNELHLSPYLSQLSEEKNSESEKKNEERKNVDDEDSDKVDEKVEIQSTKTKELQPNDEETSKVHLDTKKDDRSLKNQPNISTKPSEAQSQTDSNLTKNEKSSNQSSTKPRGNEPKTSGHNLWVSGLSSSTRATDLKNLFSRYGKVTGAKVVTNAKSPGSKCYGFVTMTSSDEASKCIQHLHRTELHGRMISVERAKADPSQVTMDKKPNQSDTDKGKGNEDRNKHESSSKSTQQSSTQERSRDKKEASTKSSNTERKPEKSANRSSRRRSKEQQSTDPSRDILTLDKIREERERERVRQWERMKRKEERRQQVMLQRERDRQREVERLQRDEAGRLAREREKLRLEKQRLELDRLKAERERVALEREKQRRERVRLEEEREQRRREMQRHERGTKRPADSSSYWPESKRAAPSPHSLRTGVHHKSESTQRDTSQFFDKKREERVKHGEKISSRRDIEIVVDPGKSSRKAGSPKIAWRPCGKLSTSPSRHHSSRDVGTYGGESQDWHTSSSTNRSRTYENSSAYGQHWSDSRQMLGTSRTWSSNNAASNHSNLGTRGSFLASASILMSSGRVNSDASRYEGYKNISSSRRY